MKDTRGKMVRFGIPQRAQAEEGPDLRPDHHELPIRIPVRNTSTPPSTT